MAQIARTDSSIIGRWWWTVDKWLLGALVALLAIGLILVFAASPGTAARIGAPDYVFVQKQLVFAILGLGVMIACSILDRGLIVALSLAGLAVAVLGVIATLLIGTEVKGATRWLSLPGFQIQPSEFLKPFYAVVAAWLLSQKLIHRDRPVTLIAMAGCALLVALLLLQPDLGMALVVAAIFGVQLFLAGLPLVLVVALGLLGAGGLVAAYFQFDHVRARIDSFLNPDANVNFQAETAASAFAHGGLFGTGPGQGEVKHDLPDAHADFIFAVAGEEFGLIFCLLLVGLFLFIVLRGFARLWSAKDLFALIAGAGLMTQFALQALINMGSTLHLIPTKGMTLPFISYGGSSLLSLALAMGFVLALTRAAPGRVAAPLRTATPLPGGAT